MAAALPARAFEESGAITRERRGHEDGVWTRIGEPALFDAALQVLRAALRSHPASAIARTQLLGEFLRLGDRDTYAKASRFRGSSRARHAFRAGILRLPYPRVNELENLRWLRAHGFRAPRPLVAAVLTRRGLPCLQALFTEVEKDAELLEPALRAATPSERADIVAQLGSTVGRMHELGFVHRDLYARNILIGEREGAPEPCFLDAWRGGPERSRGIRGARGPTYDLACLTLEGSLALEGDLQRVLIEAYAQQRGFDSRRLARFLATVDRRREALLARARRKVRS